MDPGAGRRRSRIRPSRIQDTTTSLARLDSKGRVKAKTRQNPTESAVSFGLKQYAQNRNAGLVGDHDAQQRGFGF